MNSNYNIDDLLLKPKLTDFEFKEEIKNSIILWDYKINHIGDIYFSTDLKVIIDIKKLNLPTKLTIDEIVNLIETYSSHELDTNIKFKRTPNELEERISSTITLNTNPT